MESELLRLAATAGPGATVCVVMVVIFLRYIREVTDRTRQDTTEAIAKGAERTERAIVEITGRYAADMAATRQAYQDQLDAMTQRVFLVIDNTADAVRENAVAVRGLEVAVRDLQDKIECPDA